MDELNKKILRLLGYKVSWGDDSSFTPDSFYRAKEGWVFEFNGDVISGVYDTEEEAWEGTLSLLELRGALESALAEKFSKFTPDRYSVIVYKHSGRPHHDKWVAEPASVPAIYDGLKGIGETPHEAIAELFIASCTAGLIDPSKVDTTKIR